MTIGTIIFIAVVSTLGLAVAGVSIWGAIEEKSPGLAVLSFVTLLLTAVICIVAGWWNLNSESGRRAYKSQQSNLNGGIARRVTVYDMEGDPIKSYEGVFDVAHAADKILWDDEHGQRHIIYYTTGTVIVDELPTKEGSEHAAKTNH